MGCKQITCIAYCNSERTLAVLQSRYRASIRYSTSGHLHLKIRSSAIAHALYSHRVLYITTLSTKVQQLNNNQISMLVSLAWALPASLLEAVLGYGRLTQCLQLHACTWSIETRLGGLRGSPKTGDRTIHVWFYIDEMSCHQCLLTTWTARSPCSCLLHLVM